MPGSKCEHRYSLKPVGFSQEFGESSREKEPEISFENSDVTGRDVDGEAEEFLDTFSDVTPPKTLPPSRDRNRTTEVNKILLSSRWRKGKDRTTRFNRGK